MSKFIIIPELIEPSNMRYNIHKDLTSFSLISKLGKHIELTKFLKTLGRHSGNETSSLIQFEAEISLKDLAEKMLEKCPMFIDDSILIIEFSTDSQIVGDCRVRGGKIANENSMKKWTF